MCRPTGLLAGVISLSAGEGLSPRNQELLNDYAGELRASGASFLIMGEHQLDAEDFGRAVGTGAVCFCPSAGKAYFAAGSGYNDFLVVSDVLLVSCLDLSEVDGVSAPAQLPLQIRRAIPMR